MRAILLAAGRGKRLEASGWTKPKCLLPVAGTTLLDNMLDALARYGVNDVTVVVGYQQELVREHIAQRGSAQAFTWVENPDFASTNTINSLWRARESMTDDFMYFNADVMFRAEILGRLLEAPGSRLAIDHKRCAEEEVKVVLDDEGRVLRIGKTLEPKDCAGEFIGIGKFERAMNTAFAEALRVRNEERGDVQMFFEAAVDDILAQVDLREVDISDLAAIEIDFPEDYDAAKAGFEGGGADGDAAASPTPSDEQPGLAAG